MTTSSYFNGNIRVTIYSDGTKLREYNEAPAPLFPESIDVKITDYCDLGCLYCHESSTQAGKHGDITDLLSVIAELPAGIELAIGGGNPLSHPQLLVFLKECKGRGLICNITVNQGHLHRYHDLLSLLIANELVMGVGVSITSRNRKVIDDVAILTSNVVYHVIAGVSSPEVIPWLGDNPKILILGYKQFGFGVDYYSEEVAKCLQSWYMALPAMLGKVHLSFDNLAIEQLKVRRLLTNEAWQEFYMGNDFSFTMYIDAVKQQYAPTSRSKERVSFQELTLLQYFQRNRCL